MNAYGLKERRAMSFDVDWPHGHVTEDGRKARIICRDLRSGHGSIVAAVVNHAGSSETVVTYLSDGKYIQGATNPCDLINAPAPKKRVKGWVNVYEDHSLSSLIDSRETADHFAAGRPKGFRRFGCFYIDFEEWEGM